MLKKIILTITLLLSSALSFAGENVDVTVSCVIEGHGGGCYSESIALENVPGAASLKAVITEEDCYEDETCDFCQSTTISKYESSSVNFLKVNVEEGSDALIVTKGSNDVRVNFYDASGSYITTQFVTVNASVEMTY